MRQRKQPLGHTSFPCRAHACRHRLHRRCASSGSRRRHYALKALGPAEPIETAQLKKGDVLGFMNGKAQAGAKEMALPDSGIYVWAWKDR